MLGFVGEGIGMTKASEYAEARRTKATDTTGCPNFRGLFYVTRDGYFAVALARQPLALSAQDAIKLADWIRETFE